MRVRVGLPVAVAEVRPFLQPFKVDRVGHPGIGLVAGLTEPCAGDPLELEALVYACGQVEESSSLFDDPGKLPVASGGSGRFQQPEPGSFVRRAEGELLLNEYPVLLRGLDRDLCIVGVVYHSQTRSPGVRLEDRHCVAALAMPKPD